MILAQRAPQLFVPVIDPVAVVVNDIPPTQEVVPVGGINVIEHTTTGYHNDYLFQGSNLDGLTCDDPSVDLSEFPLVKRPAGFNGVKNVRFSNGRGITARTRLVFTDSLPSTYRNGIDGTVPGSYAEYSFNAVYALCNAMTSKAMWSGGSRAQTGVIPHAMLTGHVFDGAYGTAPAGRRFMAITPRHLVGVEHYTYPVGTVLKFKTVDNVAVTAIIQAVFRGSSVPGLQGNDISFYLLTEDLPATIKPFPVAGDWHYGIQAGGTANDFDALPQYFGIVLWNNDGHLTPFMRVALETDNVTGVTITHAGVSFTPDKVDSINSFYQYGLKTNSLTTWDYHDVNSVFYHYVRGGDSGSPKLIPVAGGEWALAGIISGNFWSPSLMNSVIGLLDTSAGVSTGYTVTIAADPTL